MEAAFRAAMRALLLGSLLALGCGAHRQPLDTPPPGWRPMPRVEQPPYVVPKSAFAALSGPVGIVPSIALWDGPLTPRSLVMTPYRVNGFEAGGHGCVHFEANERPIADYELVCPIHPYFLVRGTNTLQLAEPEVDWAVTRWDYLRSATNVEITRGKGTTPGTFEWDADVPAWSWTNGAQIEDSSDTFESLLAEIQRFHAELVALQDGGTSAEARQDAFFAKVRASTAEFIRASELRGKPFAFLDDFRKALAGAPFGDRPEKSVVLAPIDLHQAWRLEVFAGGTLARLTNDRGDPIIAFQSTYDDGPWYSNGGTILGAELWYRQGDAGEWLLDAVMPVGSTEVVRHMDASLRDREEVFRRSAF